MPNRPTLNITQILEWADDHKQRYGKWPNAYSGAIFLSAIFNWRKVDNALRYGFFGLGRGSSLARLLSEHRGVWSWSTVPDLTEEQILAWADAHHAKHGSWPTSDCKAVEVASEESWECIDQTLRAGGRGLPGGSSLADLLSRHRGYRQ